ncbi:cyclin-dependent kinase 12-like isoform X2 [Sebastes umbrosus]|uniref:cyclin-dependent kinase 12-like isoform X2 n=1 Tax=Sebastes umbrosus TaxID=72105 RepID=UPI00189EB66B|nr:cyclin-dependent kinase 12-like isoform X2 [Sebastes umbrosus]
MPYKLRTRLVRTPERPSSSRNLVCQTVDPIQDISTVNHYRLRAMPYNLRTRLVRTPERPSSSRNLVCQTVDPIQDISTVNHYRLRAMPYNLRTILVRTPERPSSSRNLVCQTVDPIQDMLDNRSGGNQRATKRKSDESHERAIKTSRTSQCPSEGFRPSFSRGNFNSAEDAGTSTPACASISSKSEEKKGRKRRFEDTEAYGKRKRTFMSPNEGTSYQATTETTPEAISETIPDAIPEATPETSFRSGSDTFISTNSEEKKGRKRKSEDTGEYGKRRKTPLSSGTDTSYQGTNDTTTESTPETIPETIPETTSSDEFDTSSTQNSRGTFYPTGDAGKSAPASTKSEEKKGRKRKSEETKASGERTRTFLRPSEGTSHQATTETTLEPIPEASFSYGSDTFFSEDSGEIFDSAEDTVSWIPASTDSEEKKSRKRKSEDTGDYGKSAGTSYPWYQAPLRYLSNPFPSLFNLFFPSIPETIPETIPKAIPETIPEATAETIPEATAETIPEAIPETIPEAIPETIPEAIPETIPEAIPETIPEAIPETIPEATAETIPEATSSDSDITFPEVTLFHNRADFEAKYEEEGMLGEGSFGAVFAGHRKDDHLPVAIKRIREFLYTTVDLDGEVTDLPTEVALLLYLNQAGAGTSAVVGLLDWYNLDNELILVLERPVPCMDLYDYLGSIQSSIQEDMGRIITKQLVEGLQEVHSGEVFHRDIKMENILIETGSDVPRVWIIDFGSGEFLTGERYTENEGTLVYTTPEYIRRGWSTPEATTVWQLGAVLFEMLHDGVTPFRTSRDIINAVPDIRDTLSYNCQDFIARCMDKSPEARPTLETLKHHPWLV